MIPHLHERFPALVGTLPHLSLSERPTPVRELGGLGVWAKEDGRFGSGGWGGNKVRKLEWLIPDAQRREGISFKHDISVPVSKVPEFIETAHATLAGLYPGIRSFAFGHLGDGNIHFNPIQAAGEAELDWKRRLPDINRITHDIAVALGGSITAEHGIGRLRRDELARYKPATDMNLMARIKHALDPNGLLNPGKVL